VTVPPGNPYRNGRISTVDLLVATSLGPNVMKLFCPYFTDFSSKLECLLD